MFPEADGLRVSGRWPTPRAVGTGWACLGCPQVRGWLRPGCPGSHGPAQLAGRSPCGTSQCATRHAPESPRTLSHGGLVPECPPRGEEPVNRGGGGTLGPEPPLAFLPQCSAACQSGQKAWPQAPGGSRVGALEGPILPPPPPGDRQARFLHSHEPSQAPGPQVGVGQVSASFPSPGHESHAGPGSGCSQPAPGGAVRPWAPPSLPRPGGQRPARPAERESGWRVGPGSRALGRGQRPGLGRRPFPAPLWAWVFASPAPGSPSRP